MHHSVKLTPRLLGRAALALALAACTTTGSGDADPSTEDGGSDLDGGGLGEADAGPGRDAPLPDAAPPSWDGGPAPAWFTAAPEGEWVAIAAEPGDTIRAVLPSPVPHVEGAPGGPSGIATAWTGGGVDQVRGELLLIANGGHADYAGNEGYAISLREEHPRWRRLDDPTPNDRLQYEEPAGPDGALNDDGRPRSMHSTFECFGDDRMWFVYQNSFTSPAGDSTSACFSYWRSHPGLPGPGEPPLPWSATDLGPWTIHPNPDANWTNGFGHAAWDRVDHRVWGVGGNNNINSPQYWSVETTGPALGTSTLYDHPTPLDNFNGWVAIAHDLRILVAGGSYNSRIYVLDLTRPGMADSWQEVANVTGTGFYGVGSGGVYVEPNHTIAVGQPRDLGSSFYRLEIPTTAAGAYDREGTWRWSRIDPPGVTLTVAPGNSDINTKWNIVEDVGGNQSAIVTVTDIDGPVYVYRLPRGGL